MIHSLKRHKPALKLLILKQGFSACGLSWAELCMTRAVQWARRAADALGLTRSNHSTVEAGREEEENKARRSRAGSLQGDLGTSK